jgi:lysyl-tRNA synthetase class 2
LGAGASFKPSTTASALKERYGSLPPDSNSGEKAAVAGRVVAHRDTGKLVFAVVKDGTGTIQLFCPASVGEEIFASAKDLILGDIVGANGEVVTTRTGELSILPDQLVIIARPKRPLPGKWHGITDVETRYRKRYLDFALNDDARAVLAIRAQVLASLRRTLDRRGFIEIETPILQPLPGGAAARPFVAHYDALETDVYLRVAPELYHKRILVGGIERIYEIGRCFRNEGISTRHNPEFTMLEAYMAYGDYRDMMDLTQALVVDAALSCKGTTNVEYGGRNIELSPPWDEIPLSELVAEAAGLEIGPETSLDDARRAAESLGLSIDPSWGTGKIAFYIYDKICEEKLDRPTFVTGFPVEVSPLARPSPHNPWVAERFEAVIAGRELVNAFSELQDPDEQKRRLEEQARKRAAGDPEAMVYDEDFVTALEYGMPPAGGLGMGVDRLVMLLSDNVSIREVLAFPQLRPDRHQANR